MNWIEIAAIALFFLAFYGLITSEQMIKAVVCVSLLQTSVIVFFLGLSFRQDIAPPIGAYFEQMEYIADPFPQALMITSIIIGVAVTAITITMLMALFRKYNITTWRAIKQLDMTDCSD